jgi:hypothetical protein
MGKTRAVSRHFRAILCLFSQLNPFRVFPIIHAADELYFRPCVAFGDWVYH